MLRDSQNVKQGYGIMKWPDGTIYEGLWENNLYNGRGKLYHASGDLYEGPTDITNWKNLDLDSDPKTAERGLLMGFADAAAKAKDMNDLAPLKDWLDLGHFARFMAMEILCDHWDGYLSPNNYRIYRNPSDRKFYFIPHGADQLFRNSSNNLCLLYTSPSPRDATLSRMPADA